MTDSLKIYGILIFIIMLFIFDIFIFYLDFKDRNREPYKPTSALAYSDGKYVTIEP